MARSAAALQTAPANGSEVKDAAMLADERKQRKKIQNRLNQRACRSRNAQKGNSKVTARQRQYEINRWRIDEHQIIQQIPGSSSSEARLEATKIALNKTNQRIWFPLPADHLLHLIKYNVFKGLIDNKAHLDCIAVQYRTLEYQTDTLGSGNTFLRYAAIVAVAPETSGCLTPTQLQTSVIHSTWIDFLPFPSLRDNLIKREFDFDHCELMDDLVGDLFNLKTIYPATPSSRRILAAETTVLQDDEDDSTTASKTGLIVWGEPYLACSWEATPHFLKKWGWAVEGCQDLIDSTNRWRRFRGERPLHVSYISDASNSY